MEYADKGSLANLLQSGGFFPQRDTSYSKLLSLLVSLQEIANGEPPDSCCKS